MRHPWPFTALKGGRVWTQAQPQPATSGQEPPALPPSLGCEGGEARLRSRELCWKKWPSRLWLPAFLMADPLSFHIL